jgi:hypothetical protein
VGGGDVPAAQLERQLDIRLVGKLGKPSAERLTGFGVAGGKQRPTKDE